MSAPCLTLLLFLGEAFRTSRGSSLAESCFLLSLSRLTRPSLISSDSQGGTEGVGVSQEMIECVKQASLIKEQERRRQEREEESTRLKIKKEEHREKKRK